MIETIENLLAGPAGDVIVIALAGVAVLYAFSYLATVVAAFTPGDADDLAMGKVMDKLVSTINIFLPGRGNK